MYTSGAIQVLALLNNALLALTGFLHIPNVLAQMRLYKAVVVRFLVCTGIVPHFMVLLYDYKVEYTPLNGLFALWSKGYSPLVDDLQNIEQSQLRAFLLDIPVKYLYN